jgi:putative hydrolase of the HAD superfamily
MAKIVLLDLDGIVIRPRYKYFSEKYSEEHKVPLENILPFFKGEYRLAEKGEASIREVLPKYLTKWGWKKSLDDFLTYWFREERTLDQNVLDAVATLRKNGTKVYIASDNEKERARYVVETLKLEDYFDGIYFSYQLGHTKSEPEFFTKILGNLKAEPADVDYWDDDPKNVEVAKGIGINSKFYTSVDEL